MVIDAACNDAAAGAYAGASGEFKVTVRRVGEGLALESLTCKGEVPLAVAVEAASSLFEVPRLAADRYPDWAAFEYACRFPDSSGQGRVWRMAQNDSAVLLLGQSVPALRAHYPLVAALWRGWLRPGAERRSLFWQGDRIGHLWSTGFRSFPQYASLKGNAILESLLIELSCLGDLRDVTLDVGGVTPEFTFALAARFPGAVVPVEPFASLAVHAALRAELSRVTDPTMFLPALGAARALLDGPPAPLASCASSQAAAVAGG